MAATIGYANPGLVRPCDDLTVIWQDVVGPQPGDWIAVEPHGQPDDPHGLNRVVWTHATGYPSGTLILRIPCGTAPGNYDLRMYAIDSATLITQSQLTISPAPSDSGPTPPPAKPAAPAAPAAPAFDLSALLHNPLVIGAAGLLLVVKLGLLGGRR